MLLDFSEAELVFGAEDGLVAVLLAAAAGVDLLAFVVVLVVDLAGVLAVGLVPVSLAGSLALLLVPDAFEADCDFTSLASRSMVAGFLRRVPDDRVVELGDLGREAMLYFHSISAFSSITGQNRSSVCLKAATVR